MTVLEAIARRRSVRSYSDVPIPPEVMARMHKALRLAPSACNFQPWRFILVDDPALRRRLATAANDKQWIAQAPVIVVACGLPAEAYKNMGGCGNSVDVDVAIAIDHLTLAAVEDGLGTCWIGAFTEQAVKDLLNIPAEVKVVALTPLGYPTEANLIHPQEDPRRKPEAEIFGHNRF